MLSIEELLSRNDKSLATHNPLKTLQEHGAAGDTPPRIAIISCADPRVTPEKYFNLGPLDAVIFRNIAGHPQSCWKDIATLDTFMHENFAGGFEHIIVVHHTDCGAAAFTNDMIRDGLQKQFPDNRELSQMEFGALSTSIEQSVKDDLEWLKSAPLIRKELAENALGFVYDIKSGKLHRV